MIEEINNNIAIELQMAREMITFIGRLEHASLDEKKMLPYIITSIQNRAKLLNASVGDMLRALTLAQPLSGKEKEPTVEKLEFSNGGSQVAIRTKDKERYLQELNLSRNLLKRLRRHSLVKEEEEGEYKAANAYAQLSNHVFFNVSNKLLEKGYFKNLNIDLRKGNILVLTATYLSMMFFSTILAILIGVAAAVFMFFFSVSPAFPFIAAQTGEVLARLQTSLWFLIVPPLVTMAGFYFYPGMERKSLARQIDSELPFVVIHMGSISGSGIEPTQIFKIVGLNKDYKHTRGEIRKLLNQVNVYGYDLITSLKNVARLTPSTRLAELFNGLSTTISSGGDLKIFFEKRADSLLLNYRLERERFTKIAETFMDIYISVVIATPMILLLLLVMISVSGVNIGNLSLGAMTFIIIFLVAFVNVIFLWLLSVKQPAY